MRAETPALESAIARLLTIGTYASIVLVAAGAVALIVDSTSALAVAPSFDPARLPGDLAAVRPAGLLWLGIIGVIATPGARVVAALVGYVRSGERAMALVAGLILVVIAAGVLTGLASG